MKKDKTGQLPDIIRTVIMDAPIEKVWKAVSSPEGLAVWLMPNDFKPELGYEFTFISKPKGDWDGIVHCKVMELEPPNRVGFDWCGNNLEQYVSFDLVEINGKTQFTLTHSGWTEENFALREVMYDGWGYLTEGLKVKLGDGNGGLLS